MRIAFTGAHGTGKSTLATPLARELDLPELGTPGRWLKARGIAVNKDAGVDTQAIAWFLQYQFEHEHDSWITSRSMLDILAYAAVPAAERDLTVVEQTLLDQMTLATRDHLLAGHYDLLIYTPPRIPLVADEVRIADDQFQADTDAFILARLTEWNTPHLLVDVTDPDAYATIQASATAI